MFVWECIKKDGRHIGMCMDGFMFGSCCNVNPKPVDSKTTPSEVSLSTASSTQESLSTEAPSSPTRHTSTSRPVIDKTVKPQLLNPSKYPIKNVPQKRPVQNPLVNIKKPKPPTRPTRPPKPTK